MVYRYDDEEWDNIIAKDPEWSRDETDYLLDLCDTFKLRFVPIADRYEVRGSQISQTSWIQYCHGSWVTSAGLCCSARCSQGMMYAKH